MVRVFLAVAAVVLGLGCSGDRLCPAGSEMNGGVCRISTPAGELDLVLPGPADVAVDAAIDLGTEILPADGRMPPDSFAETTPSDLAEILEDPAGPAEVDTPEPSPDAVASDATGN